MYNGQPDGPLPVQPEAEVSLTVNNLLYTSPQDNGGGLWPYYWPQLQNGAALGRSAYLSLRYSFN